MTYAYSAVGYTSATLVFTTLQAPADVYSTEDSEASSMTNSS